MLRFQNFTGVNILFKSSPAVIDTYTPGDAFDHRLAFLRYARDTSFLLGDYFENFIKGQITSGEYNSADEVARVALRTFEQAENKTKTIVKELKKREKSPVVGFV